MAPSNKNKNQINRPDLFVVVDLLFFVFWKLCYDPDFDGQQLVVDQRLVVDAQRTRFRQLPAADSAQIFAGRNWLRLCYRFIFWSEGTKKWKKQSEHGPMALGYGEVWLHQST